MMAIYNDENFGEASHDRVHMIYLSVIIIAKSSEANLLTEARKWKGESNIAIGKGKKRYTFIGRESIAQEVNDDIINKKLGTFKGLHCIPDAQPVANYKLWPIVGTERTLFA